MKFCNHKNEEAKMEYIKPEWIPGHVYQMVDNHPRKGELYIAYVDGSLVNLAIGVGCSGQDRFGSFKLRDVTDYVCLDTSRLPPMPEYD